MIRRMNLETNQTENKTTKTSAVMIDDDPFGTVVKDNGMYTCMMSKARVDAKDTIIIHHH
jgi:hypothetical protein